jgi:hypothetical protein
MEVNAVLTRCEVAQLQPDMNDIVCALPELSKRDTDQAGRSI